MTFMIRLKHHSTRSRSLWNNLHSYRIDSRFWK